MGFRDSFVGSATAVRLTAQLGDRWIDPHSPSYQSERRVFNGAINRNPYGIAKCESVKEIAAVLEVLRETGLRASVRSGGHNVAGRSIRDGGVVIDLSRMKQVEVDIKAATATAQAGVSWREFDRCTQTHDLAVTGGTVSSTGIAGLTLGGGIGWLLPSMGLTCDNLLSAKVVTTAGDVLTVSEAENTDLLWALRGGGHGFGVVTEFTYRLRRLDRFAGGAVVYELFDAEAILFHLSALFPDLPRSVMVSPALLWQNGRPILELDIAIHGPMEHLDALGLDHDYLPAPVTNTVCELPYCEMQQLLDNEFRNGMCAFWKSGFVSQLSRHSVRHLIDAIRESPSRASLIMIEHYHGAYSDLSINESAYPHRSRSLNVLFVANWKGLDCAAERDVNERWARQALSNLPDRIGCTPYLNYAVDEDLAGGTGEPAVDQKLARARRILDPAEML